MTVSILCTVSASLVLAITCDASFLCSSKFMCISCFCASCVVQRCKNCLNIEHQGLRIEHKKARGLDKVNTHKFIYTWIIQSIDPPTEKKKNSFPRIDGASRVLIRLALVSLKFFAVASCCSFILLETSKELYVEWGPKTSFTKLSSEDLCIQTNC